MHQFSGNQKIIKKHKQKTKNTQTKKQTTTKIQNEKPKKCARVLCICFFAFFLVSFLIFFFSGDSGIPDLHFSLEKKQKRR
jgi:ABC-type Fe3+ transport system permease subunit